FRVARRESTCGGTLVTSVDTGAHLQVEQVEDAPRAMAVCVLVECALAGAPPELLRLRGVVEQLAVGRARLRRGVDDDELAPRLEPALHPLTRIRDDRRPRRRELERAARRRGVEAGVRPPRDVEVDTRRRDRARERVERDVAEL